VSRPKTFDAFLDEQGLDRAEVNVDDLRLAWECLQHDPKALAELDRRIRAVCGGLSQKKGFEVRDVDELCQRVREKVLVTPQGGRLSAYRGRGALVKWLQAVAASVAIDAARAAQARREDSDEDEVLAATATSESAEGRLLHAAGKRSFTAAFKAALDELSVRERTALRMRYVDQANLEDIARAYGVHRTSVMRWLETAQQQLLVRTRELLGAKLKLSPSELDSLMRDFELSLEDRLSRLFPKAR
jgi:RNA polymerase sigma-70 factor, ECF subfamily